MPVNTDPQKHIGRCRCEECAKKYKPASQNQHMKFYYVPPKYVPKELLCTNCLKKDPPMHGGIIISEDARKIGMAVFAAGGPGWELTDEQKKAAAQIWP
jgi:hypothetical protein